MEMHHWLPQDIAEIPYKKLQKILIISRQKRASMEAKAQQEQIKSENRQSGGRKKFYRNV